MQDYGLVSIIMPTWACASLIGDTIKSVQGQSYTNWELLIQDDCSTDNTSKVVQTYSDGDARIKYECNPQNSGAAVTRNNALKRARGRWIAFLDSDDLWESTKLEKQLKFMVDNKINLLIVSHQFAPGGFCTFNDDKLLVVFSATNYMNKSGNNFYDKKIKEKFFDGNISYSGNTNNIITITVNIILNTVNLVGVFI